MEGTTRGGLRKRLDPFLVTRLPSPPSPTTLRCYVETPGPDGHRILMAHRCNLVLTVFATVAARLLSVHPARGAGNSPSTAH
jgi:hypothetical protein